MPPSILYTCIYITISHGDPVYVVVFSFSFRSSSFQSKLEGILEGKSVSLMQGGEIEEAAVRWVQGGAQAPSQRSASGLCKKQADYSTSCLPKLFLSLSLSLLLLPIVLRNFVAV